MGGALDDFFEQLFERHPDGCAMLELREGRARIVRANASESRRLGRAGAELEGKLLDDALPAEVAPAWRAAMERAAASGAPTSVRDDDADLETTIVPLTSSDGATRFFAQTRAREDALGVSSRLAKLQEIAKRSDAELQALFDHNQDGVLLAALDEPIAWDETVDKDALVEWALDHLRPTRVNNAYCNLFGVTREEIQGATVREIGPRFAPPSPHEHLRKLFDDGHLHLRSTQRARPDGSTWVADSDRTLIRDQEGRITGMYGITRDVTSRERAEEALRATEERYRLTLESAELYFWTLDIPTERIEVDPRWADHLGYPRDDFSSRSVIRTRTHPVDSPLVRERIDSHLAGRTPRVYSVHREASIAGEWRWVEMLGSVIARDAAGKPLRLFGILRDVTDRRMLEQRLLVAETMASMGTMAAGVGHELNNPLTYVALNLTSIDKALGKLAGVSGIELEGAIADLRAMLANVRDGTSRITRIVANLRSMARAAPGRPGPIDIHAVIERSLELADHQIRHRAHVVRDLAPVPHVLGDEGRLLQVLVNLLVNAAQAMREGAADSNRIRVATRTEHGQVVVDISDTGSGIAPEVLAHVFDPFFTTKQIGEGSGLGLAICRSIVSELGGTIEVESEVGRGSTFRLRLPVLVEASEAPPVPVSEPQAPTPRAQRMRVLVIDDSPFVARAVVSTLRDYDVVQELRAADALTRLRTGERFHRILCDVMMPEMTGMDFFRELAAIDPKLTSLVIFMTGGAFTERAASFVASVTNPTLAKPFTEEELRRVLTQPLVGERPR